MAIYKEKNILEILDQVINDPQIMNSLVPLIEEAKSAKHLPVTKNIPLFLFKDRLPNQLNLCRIFVLPANTKSKIERHPNSFQRTFSIFGSGDTKVFNNNIWVSNVRTADGKTFEDRWLSVPKNTWHQPIALSSNWITITFHTASENKIIDMYKD